MPDSFVDIFVEITHLAALSFALRILQPLLILFREVDSLLFAKSKCYFAFLTSCFVEKSNMAYFSVVGDLKYF